MPFDEVPLRDLLSDPATLWKTLLYLRGWSRPTRFRTPTALPCPPLVLLARELLRGDRPQEPQRVHWTSKWVYYLIVDKLKVLDRGDAEPWDPDAGQRPCHRHRVQQIRKGVAQLQ
ncbi:hypothetical protein B0H14DRAFT_2615384 [Mycena olivaceomarginata]|nr:hypothetical protein B0H14DRAFT_2615384 [Mycena olivaceomarginata]